MKVLFIGRATLYKDKGGDTVQVLRTADYLRKLGIDVTIRLTNETIDYREYQLLHFFNIIRPADILHHIQASGKPYVVSTIFVDYSEFEKKARKGIMGLVFNLLPADTIEYLKVVARQVVAGEKIISPAYLLYGQRRSVRRIMRGAAMLLPNSASEYRRLAAHYGQEAPYRVIPNGIDPSLFHPPAVAPQRDDDLVLCVGRIEGRKSQLNLIRALNGTRFRLAIIGSSSANQAAYYDACRREAGPNISFIGSLTQEALLDYYSTARVHVLPSWFETTGLSSLEAGVMGCNLVITDKGDTREYFGDDAWYCDPASPESIFAAIDQASRAAPCTRLQKKIATEYTWEQTAERTVAAYREINLPEKTSLPNPNTI